MRNFTKNLQELIYFGPNLRCFLTLFSNIQLLADNPFHSLALFKIGLMKYCKDQFLKYVQIKLKKKKVIKFYGWELSFQKIVNKIRNDEMKFFSRNALVGVVGSFTWASAPFLVATVSYSTFVLINDKNNLDPSTAFVSFTLFYLIRFPLALLPQTISLCVQGYIALKLFAPWRDKWQWYTAREHSGRGHHAGQRQHGLEQDGAFSVQFEL